MTTAAPSTALAAIQPTFTDAERLALAGFLAGYRGLTREACALDLRQFAAWCRARSLPLFAVRRAGIESFARELEARGRARATVTRRLCTIARFYRYAIEEELLEHSPAAHVRRPRVDYESHKGGKVVTIPLAPRTARAIDLASGERTGGPVFLAADGRRPGRHGAGRIVRKAARRAGICKIVTPHTLRHAFITAALDAGVPARCPGSRLTRRPADHNAIRPSPRQSGPACDRHRRRLHRRSRPVTRHSGWKPALPGDRNRWAELLGKRPAYFASVAPSRGLGNFRVEATGLAHPQAVAARGRRQGDGMPIPRIVRQWNKAGLNRVTKHIAPWAPGMGVIIHRGRRSGRLYQTPVSVFAAEDGYVFALTYGPDTDWVKNVLAAGGCELRTRRHATRLTSPRLYHDESRRDIRPVERQVLRMIGVADFLFLKTVPAGAPATGQS